MPATIDQQFRVKDHTHFLAVYEEPSSDRSQYYAATRGALVTVMETDVADLDGWNLPWTRVCVEFELCGESYTITGYVSSFDQEVEYGVVGTEEEYDEMLRDEAMP